MPAGNRLRALRLHHGLTIYDLGELADIHPSTISKLETGTTPRVNVTTAEALADALYVPISRLFAPSEITELGRAAHTSGTEYRKEATELVRSACPKCHMELLPCGLCGWCG